MNTKNTTENTILYSPKYFLGLGINHQTSEDNQKTNLHLGWLVNRWNEFGSQGNLYLYGGPGVQKKYGENAFFQRGGIHADFETREIYTMAKAEYTHSKLESDFDVVSRVGFAPYVAEYDEINAWMILQYHWMPRSDQTRSSWTPMVRLFYKNVLLELGSSLKREWMINFMVRYY